MRRALILILLAVASLPAAAQIPSPRDLLRILLPRVRVDTTTSSSKPPPGWNGSRERPGGYQVLTRADRPCHVGRQRLPLCIYSQDDGQARVVAHAVTSWNQVGGAIGLGSLFEIVTVRWGADVRVEWSRRGLPGQAVAATWWDQGFGVQRVRGITVDPDPAVPDGNRAEILMQELGHVLGLSHSDDSQDVMYSTMHTRRYPKVDSARPSGRDAQALAWLYDQSDFVPIVGLRDTEPWPEPSPLPSPSPAPSPLPKASPSPISGSPR